MFEDDFELKQEINDDIKKTLLTLQQKHDIVFVESNFEWEYSENLY